MAQYIKTLEELQDRMIKAGFLVRHGYSKHGNVAEFTPIGKSVIEAFAGIDRALGPLTGQQVQVLWIYFREIAKGRSEGR